jgi:tRNA A-37 threonylcarbamoyl transferase component Bud32
MIGSQIGNFRVIDKLGEGGMGVVYKAVDIGLDRPVAIKMLNADLARNPELVQRFQSEARAQANLNHTNLATLYAFLVDQGNAYMVMEFVEGENFDQIIRRSGPMGPRDAVPWFKQALLGIGAAHRVGIIHRDIKPSNLMLNRQGIVKVMDFGIAKAVGTRGMTRTGMQLGTLAYMSPEQIQNRPVDVRSDIYQLGVTLYEMLSGHVPFESDSDFQMMHDHVSSPPPPLTRYYPYAPKEFESVVAKALAKNPDDRFQTVEEFGAGLEHPENIAAPPPPPMPVVAARGTVVETGVAGAAAAAVAPAAAAVAPAAAATLSAPATVAVVPGAAAGATASGGPGAAAVAQPPQPRVPSRISGKMIAAGTGVAVVIVLAVALWPGKKPPVGPGPGPGPAPRPNPTPQRSQQDSADIVVATGGEETTKTATPDTARPTAKATPVPGRKGVGDQSQRDGQRYQTAQTQPTPQYQPTPEYQQPTPPPTPQPTPPPTPRPANGQSFIVRHRHVVMYGLQSATYYCAGVLAVKADGTVAYACGATNDPSRRCEQVVFPPGTIHQVKIRAGGELHIGTSGMGNWDFFDYQVAGSTNGAYQAILPFVR